MYPTPHSRSRPTPPNDSEDFLVNRLSTVPLLHLLPNDPDTSAFTQVPYYNATVTAQEVAKDRYAFYGRGGAGNWRRPSDWNFTSVLSPTPQPTNTISNPLSLSRSRSPSPSAFGHAHPHPLIRGQSNTSSIDTLGSLSRLSNRSTRSNRSGTSSLRGKLARLRSRKCQSQASLAVDIDTDNEGMEDDGASGEGRRYRLRRRVSWLVEMVRPLVSRSKSGSGSGSGSGARMSDG